MKMPKPNLEELDAIYDHIRSNRRNWLQTTWARFRGAKPPSRLTDPNVCGTSFCFAGHAVLRAGATFYWEENYNSDGWQAMDCRLPHRSRETIADAAQRILGLTEFEAQDLFCGSNNLSDIKAVIKRIRARASDAR